MRRCRSSATPSAPDWEKKPDRPAGGQVGASDAFEPTRSGSVLMMPEGSWARRTRIPFARASATSRRWRSAPSAPVSAKPTDTTISAAHALGRAVGDDLVDLGRPGPRPRRGRRRRACRAPSAYGTDARRPPVGRGVHGVHGAGEAAVEQVAQHDAGRRCGVHRPAPITTTDSGASSRCDRSGPRPGARGRTSPRARSRWARGRGSRRTTPSSKPLRRRRSPRR